MTVKKRRRTRTAVLCHNPFIHFVQRKAVTFVINFEENHFCATAEALKWIVSQGREKKSAPVVKGKPETVLFVG